MLSKKQFFQFYEEAVAAIKQIKLYNEKLNKKMGITNTSFLVRESQAETQVVGNLQVRVQLMIQKMQKSYLDPETARKIGTVKQQLRNQKQRRSNLLDNLEQIKKTMEPEHKTVEKPKVTQTFELEENKFGSSDPYQYHLLQDQTSETVWHKRVLNMSMQTTDKQQHEEQTTVEIKDYDHQMQQKILHERSQELGKTQSRLNNLKYLMNKTQQEVYHQGEVLDLISDDLFIAHKNVSESNVELNQANSQNRRLRKKICALTLLICIGIATLALIYINIF